MNPLDYLKLAIVAALMAATWQVQEWRFDAKEKNRVETEAAQNLADVRNSAARAIRARDNEIDALNAAAARMAALRRDADNSRSALVGLSHAADQALRDAAASHEACIVTATAQNLVLKASAERYRDLGEVCDRHVSDIQTLSDTWQ